MKLLLIFIIVYSLTPTVSVANSGALFDSLKSSDPDIRSGSFYELIKIAPVPKRISYDCGFNVSDISAAKAAVIGLLRRERNFDFDAFYRNVYSVRFTQTELYKHVNDENVEKYLYAKESYGDYLSALEMFVDSCLDESAVGLLPGSKTFNKYPNESVTIILSKLNGSGNISINDDRNYLIIQLGDWATKYRVRNELQYRKVKDQLLKAAEDSELGNTTVNIMGEIGDSDFVPILERISQYPDSKGRVIESGNGKTITDPISLEAKKALKRIQGQTTIKPQIIIKSSATKQSTE